MSVTKVTDAMRNVTQVDAAKITTGTIPDARIQASGVTQHVTATDLTAVHQAIATLGLHTAVSDNKAAYNLPNAFIDTFEDDTGIATETTVDRNTNEYVSSATTTFGSTAYATGDRSSTITVTDTFSTSGANGTSQNLVDGTSNTSATNAWIPPVGASVSGETIVFDYLVGNSVVVDEAKLYQPGNKLEFGVWTWQGANDAGGPWTSIGGTFTFGQTSTTPQTQTTLNGNTTGYRYYRVLGSSGTTASDWLAEIDFKQAVGSSTTSATGTLVSTVQTAPVATTTLSGVILYTDDIGTNALGTDLKIYLTANLQGTTPNWTGTTWTEAASYGTAQTFSGTTKQVKLGKTTVTSGTAVAMKGVWANQVAATYTDHSTTAGWGESGTIANLFDNNLANNMVTGGGGTQWFTQDLGSGNEKAITRYTMTSHTGSSNASPASWTIAGSNNTTSGNDGTWVDVDTKSGQSVWGSNEKRTFDFVNVTAYRYWKITMTATGGGAAPELAEMEYMTQTAGKVAQLNGWAVNY